MLALNTAGVGVDNSGGNKIGSRWPRTLLERGAIVGRDPSETLDELVSESANAHGMCVGECECGLSGGVGGCNLTLVVGETCGEGNVWERTTDGDRRGRRGRGALAVLEYRESVRSTCGGVLNSNVIVEVVMM
jgi:hypothetical protein